MKTEYDEGPKARKKFERIITGLFRVPKSVITEKIKAKKKKRQGLAALRWPRPCLGLMYGVGAFASQLLVSKSAVCDMTHDHLKAVAIGNEMVFLRAIVAAEHLLIHIAEQMERLNSNVGAFSIRA